VFLPAGRIAALRAHLTPAGTSAFSPEDRLNAHRETILAVAARLARASHEVLQSHDQLLR
jgi:hypothetical protein